MPEIDALMREGTDRLARAGVDGARFEARLLLEMATGLTREQLVMAADRRIGVVEAQVFRALLARRAAREPMAYIRGRTEFFGLEFQVAPGVLVPRADSETLIEVAQVAFPDEAAPLRILDLGVGSGCLLVTLLSLYPAARGVGTDTAETALAVTLRNALTHGVAGRVELRRTSWGRGLRGPFDLVLANPPYVGTTEIAALQPEVAIYEPVGALDGGPDGLAAYGALTPDITRLLAPGGVAVLEIGRGQDRTLTGWFKSQGFTVRPFSDLAGSVRCLELRSRAASS